MHSTSAFSFCPPGQYEVVSGGFDDNTIYPFHYDIDYNTIIQHLIYFSQKFILPVSID